MRSTKKVDMIHVRAYHFHLDPIPLPHAHIRFSDYPDSLFIEKGFPVLNRKDHVIIDLPCPEAPFSDSAFTIHLPSTTRPPCSKLQETLKLGGGSR